MKKTIICTSLVVFWAIAFASCGGGAQKENATGDSLAGTEQAAPEKPKKAPSNLKTERDSVAYAMGIDLGSYLKNIDTMQLKGDLNLKNVIAAINDVMRDKTKMDKDEAFGFLQEFFMVRIPERKKKEGEEFLANIEKENRNLQKTESGLMYEILEPGDDNVKAVKDEDMVKVLYEGRLRTGEVFDSSEKQGGDTIEFALNRVIRGWGEGMKLVGKGGKIKLYIPTDLGYGQRGMPPAIGPNEPLIFEVTLIDVIPAPETEQPKDPRMK